jgi:hypothetical protein
VIVVGVVVLWIWQLACSALAQTEALASASIALPAQCISGYQSQEAHGTSAVDSPVNSSELSSDIRRWMDTQRWQAGYQLWQQARLCHSGFARSAACTGSNPAPASEDVCVGPADGYEFLAMHRHLLHSQRALWPSRSDLFASWRVFPTRDDYPANQFRPWPKAVVRAAEAVDRLRRLPREEVLARWPNEGAFGQWLQCGTTAGGLAVDSLYGALLSNGPAASLSVQSPLDSIDFWRAHGWIDRAWDAYRKALGKTPDDPQLQAALIKQCQIQSAWLEQAADRPAVTQPAVAASSINPAPLFINGELNAQKPDKWTSLLGEVDSTFTGSNGRVFFKFNLRLVGVKAIWFTSIPAITPGEIKIGERYWVTGLIQPIASLDSSGGLAASLGTPNVLLATSIQTIR